MRKLPELLGVMVAFMIALICIAIPLDAKTKKESPVPPAPELPHIGPEIKGPIVKELPVKISCIPQASLVPLVNNVKLTLVFYSIVSEKNIIKLIYADVEGRLLVVLLDHEKACFVFDMADTQAHDGSFFQRLGPSEKG